jgi:uncharacterized membrane protein YkoI
MNAKRIWQSVVIGGLVVTAAGTVALATDVVSRQGLTPVSAERAYGGERDDDHYGRGGADYAAGGLDIDAALAAVRAAGYGEVREIERERYGYEVKARDAQGVAWEIRVDGQTGEIIDRERD